MFDMKLMKCRKAQASIENDILGLLSPNERDAMHAHLAQCTACRDVLAAAQATAASFKSAFSTPSPDESLLAKLRWRIQCEETQVKRTARRWNTMRRIGRFAACLALALGATVLAWSRISDAYRTGCVCHPWQLTGIQSVDVGGMVRPLVCDQRVFAMQLHGKKMQLVALNRHTGAYLWRVNAAFEGAPAANGTCVFVWVRGADGSRQLAAHDAATGRECWRRPFPDTSHVARPREIVVGDHGVGWADRNAVTWLDAHDGRPKWVATLIQSETLRPKLSVGPNYLILVDAQQVCALSLTRGNVLWSQKLEAGLANWLEPRISVDGANIAIARTIGPTTERLLCLDSHNGRMIWTRDTATTARHLLFQNDTLFIRGRELMALDGKTGAQLWTVPVDGCSPVTLADGKLYLMEGSRGLFAVDPLTGATVWRADGLASCSGIAVVGRMGYVRTTNGILHAIRLIDGVSHVKEQQARDQCPATGRLQRMS